MNSEQRREIQSFIDENRDQMLSFLADIVEKPSVSGHEEAAQEAVVEKLESMGLTVDVWEPNVEELRDHPGYFDTNTPIKNTRAANTPKPVFHFPGNREYRTGRSVSILS